MVSPQFTLHRVQHGSTSSSPAPAASMPSSTQPDRRPRCPLHPHSAGEIIHRPGRESTTSTTTAPRPVRATPNSGPHWKPTADPAGSSSNHAHDQTGPRCPRPCYGKTPGRHRPAYAAAAPRPPANLVA